jgi:uracil phosphoribosyltransferase
VKRDHYLAERTQFGEVAEMTDAEMLAVAVAQARQGLAEGGIPIGAALFDADGQLLGSGRNRRVQQNDPSIHGETDAFRNAGRVGYYGDKTMVSTLAPCLYCSGLIRQFGIGRVVVGEAQNFPGAFGWLRDGGTEVVNLDDANCVDMMGRFIAENPELWTEDIGKTEAGTPASAAVKLVDHPVAQAALTILRAQTTGAADFRENSVRLAALLVAEALRELSTHTVSVETPLALAVGRKLARPVCLVPVLRAGLALLEPARELLPNAAVGFIGLERDEETAVARAYYQKLPQNLSEHHVMLLDPMLATGGSMSDSVIALREAGAETITVVCVVAAPEGIARLRATAPGIRIIAAAVDDRLDEKAYIVPGLGDYGDRYFGT